MQTSEQEVRLSPERVPHRSKSITQPDTHEPGTLCGQVWKLLWSLLPLYHLSPHMAHFIEASKPSSMLFPLPEVSFPSLPAKSFPSMGKSLLSQFSFLPGYTFSVCLLPTPLLGLGAQ